MSKLSQHAAVVKFTHEVLGSRYEHGTDVKLVATKDDKRAIATRIAEAMIEGQVELSDSAKLKYGASVAELTTKYVVGMVTNWFNKSLELNGGSKYEAKNPGSRAGQSDPQIREMRLLRKHLVETGNGAGVEQVDAAIAERVAQIKAAKSAPQRSIDVDALPEELRALLND